MDAPELERIVRRNPYRFFTQAEIGKLFGFGEDVMTLLARAGAPIVGRKMNPHLLLKWIEEHSEAIGKVHSRSE